MRFIIKEQPYEKLLAAGQFRYERDGEPTGAMENWRLTAAADGYQFLRVDLDARAAKSGHTYLYHALLNEDGRIERLKYRFWGNSLQITGDVVLEDKSVTGTRKVNDASYDQALELPAGYGFWFPSTIGLGIAARLPGGIPLTTVTLNNNVNAPDAFALQQVELTRYMMITDFVEEEINGQKMLVSPCKVAWLDNLRFVSLSAEDGWPVKMQRLDGLTAVAVRHIQYQ